MRGQIDAVNEWVTVWWVKNNSSRRRCLGELCLVTCWVTGNYGAVYQTADISDFDTLYQRRLLLKFRPWTWLQGRHRRPWACIFTPLGHFIYANLCLLDDWSTLGGPTQPSTMVCTDAALLRARKHMRRPSGKISRSVKLLASSALKCFSQLNIFQHLMFYSACIHCFSFPELEVNASRSRPGPSDSLADCDAS